MNRKLIISLVLGSALFLGGCFGGGSPDEYDIDHQEEITQIGVLKLQTGVYTDLPGTHFLEAEDGNTTPLASLYINLSDAEYLNNEVEVIGSLKEATVGEQFLEVQMIKTLKELSGQGFWQVYTNSDWGLRIAYKNDWQVEESDDSIMFIAPGDADQDEFDTVSISKSFHGSDVEFADMVASEIGAVKASGATRSKIGVDQVDALKLKNGSSNDLSYFVQRVDYLYTIKFDGQTGADLLDHRNTFSEMLLDFQFIGMTGESDATDGTDSTDGTDETDEDGVVDGMDTDTDHGGDNEPVAQGQELTVLNILKDSPSSFNSALSGKQISRADFVQDKYVYIEFNSGDDRMRHLYEYEFASGGVVSSAVLAKYKPGSVTDWTLSDGTNPIIGEESSVHIISAGGDVSSSVLVAGFRYFESDRFEFRLQYPSNWYYAGSSSSDENTVYRYQFSDGPVDDNNALMTVSILSDDASGAGGTVVNVGDVKLLISGDDSGLVKQVADSVEKM